MIGAFRSSYCSIVPLSSCSLGGPLLYRSPVVVFLDRGYPCFRNFNSTVPVDVVRVKSYVNSFLDPMCVPVRISINKLDLIPDRIVAGLVGVLQCEDLQFVQDLCFPYMTFSSQSIPPLASESVDSESSFSVPVALSEIPSITGAAVVHPRKDSILSFMLLMSSHPHPFENSSNGVIGYLYHYLWCFTVKYVFKVGVMSFEQCFLEW